MNPRPKVGRPPGRAPTPQRKIENLMQYYAKTWPCGNMITETRSNTGRVVSQNVVNVYAFPTAKARDEAVENYRAPNHCPQAFAEAVKANDEDVRRLQRADDGYGEGPFDSVEDHDGERE